MRAALIALLLAHLALGLWYSTTLPILEGEDETAHYAYLRYLVKERRLPRISPEIIQAYHPPLYYALGALITFWIPEGELPVRNSYWGYDPYRFGVDNKNFYIHSPAESFPYRGAALTVHLVRLMSALFGVGTVALVFATARTAFPERPEIAWGAGAFAAFLPAFLGSISAVSNDSLAALLGASVIFVAVRGARHGFTLRGALAMGVLGGLLLLNKLSTAFVLAPALLAVIAFEVPRSSRTALVRLALALGPMVALPLPWFIRNYRLYGDLTNLRELDRVLGVARRQPLTLAQFADNAWSGFTRFWLNFGLGQILAPNWVYMALAGLTFLALIGLARWWRAAPRDERTRSVAILSGIFAALAVIGVLAYIAINVHGAQTRLFLFPALPAIAPLLVLGWLEWIPLQWRTWHGAVLFAAAMLAFALMSLIAVLRPAFSRPLIAPNARLPVRTISPPIRFGDAVELIGGEARPARVAPGDDVTALVCWRALGPTPTNLSEFAHIVDADLNKIGERETYPGLGRLPSLFWSAGDRFCDEIRIRLKEWDGGPALLPVVVGYFDQNGALPAYSGDRLIESAVTIGRVAAQAKAPPSLAGMIPLPTTFGGAVDLLGYQVLPPTADDPLYRLRLYWRSRAAVMEDYVVFVHWLDETGTPISLSDSPPRSGAYPTSAWSAGEIVVDDHPLPLAANASGPTHFEVGLYLPAIGERLSAEGAAVADQAATFPGPVLGGH